MSQNLKNKIYCVSALFKTPDQIIHAAEQVVAKGFTRFEVHTPYPLHGMDRAMSLPPSNLPYVPFFCGMAGALFALFFQWWTSAVDYKLVIGGKPFFSLPAFIPVVFEIAVLSAALTCVFAMLFLFCKLPNNSSPLQNTEYLRRVTSDRFGILVEATDPLFNETALQDLFRGMDPNADISTLYFNPPTKTPFTLARDYPFYLFLVAVGLVVSIKTIFIYNVVLYKFPFTWGIFSQKVVPQATVNIRTPGEKWPIPEGLPFVPRDVQGKPVAHTQEVVFQDGFAMREPVPGTVARGFLPYPYRGHPDQAEKNLFNPLPATKEVLAKGQSAYMIFCAMCHDSEGKGQARLKGFFPNPPSLHSGKLKAAGDGLLYHIISEGQNIMPAYAKQIPREDRWAIVHYLRALQRSQDARDSDL